MSNNFLYNAYINFVKLEKSNFDISKKYQIIGKYDNNLKLWYNGWALYTNVNSIDQFKIWIQKEPENIMLKNWKQLICDYWYFKQTDNLIRGHWSSERSILYDLKVLLKASATKLLEMY